jgi:hypothetical protein
MALLLDLRSPEGFWRGHLSEPNDLAGSANILDLISLPEVQEIASSQDIGGELKKVRKALLLTQKAHGWPSSFGASAPALVSTIQVLHTGFDALLTDRHDVNRDRIRGVLNYIADELIAKNGCQRLDSWDWAMLGRLSALVLGRAGVQSVPESLSVRIGAATEHWARRHSTMWQLLWLASLPRIELCDQSNLFIISFGKPGTKRAILWMVRNCFKVGPFLRHAFEHWIIRRLVGA